MATNLQALSLPALNSFRRDKHQHNKTQIKLGELEIHWYECPSKGQAPPFRVSEALLNRPKPKSLADFGGL
jgi:hypothetical protein